MECYEVRCRLRIVAGGACGVERRRQDILASPVVFGGSVLEVEDQTGRVDCLP